MQLCPCTEKWAACVAKWQHVCKGLGTRLLLLCISRHLWPLVALPTGKKEAAAGHAPDLCWAVASIVGKTNSLILDHIAACSKASCIPQLFYNFFAYGREFASCWGNCTYICCFCAVTKEGKNLDAFVKLQPLWIVLFVSVMSMLFQIQSARGEGLIGNVGVNIFFSEYIFWG